MSLCHQRLGQTYCLNNLSEQRQGEDEMTCGYSVPREQVPPLRSLRSLRSG